LYLTLDSQLQGFLVSVLTGVLLGALYDIFRIYRTVFRPEKRAVFFQDLFYMICAAFVTFLLALGVNYGEIRFYILAGEAIGWCLYYLTIGMVTVQVFRFVSRILRRYLIYPVKRVFHRIFHWIFHKLKILCKNVKTAAENKKKRLKQHRQIVYNQSDRRRKSRKTKSGKRKSKSGAGKGRKSGGAGGRAES
jgi:Spore cortex protein YabQ (Spore_YabQ).